MQEHSIGTIISFGTCSGKIHAPGYRSNSYRTIGLEHSSGFGFGFALDLLRSAALDLCTVSPKL